MPRFFHGKTTIVILAAAALAPVALRAESDLSLDNLVFTLGATTYRIPRLELKGASLPAAEFSTLFSGDEKAIDARLARLSAKSLVIPSMTSETTSGDETHRILFRDLRAEDIRGGRFGVVRIAAREETDEKSGAATERDVATAAVSKGVDLRQIVHIALAARTDPNEALKPVIDEDSVERYTIEDPRAGLSVTIGPMKATGVKGRAFLAAPWSFFERFERFDPDKPGADPTLIKDFVDALASVEVASLDIRDIAATGKGAPADKPYTVRIGRVFAGKISNAAIGDAALEDFSLVSSDGGKASLKHFGMRDVRVASFVENAYPQIGHVEAKGLEADLPDAHLAESSRMKFSLAGVEANFSDFREIAPTKLSAHMDRFVIDLAARGEAPSTAQFLALGYRDLDLSAALAGEWAEKSQEATFAPLRFEGKDMGAATLKVTFGNVSSAIFSSMPIVSKAAALAASVKGVEATVEGGGLIDRLLALEAREQKTSVEKARADYARSASRIVAALAGGGDKANRIADAIGAYIMKPKRLHVRLSSQKGVGALDLLAKSPADILESVDVEATAER